MGERLRNVILVFIWTFCVICIYNEFKLQQILDSSSYQGFSVIDEDASQSIDIGHINLKAVELDAGTILKIMGTRDAVEAVQPNQSTTYIQPYPLDVKLKYGLNRLIVIMVTSMMNSVVRRNLIRQSWAKWCENFDCRVLFFLGIPKGQFPETILKLEKENELYGDLIVDNFTENYYRLTSKVLRMMKWFIGAYGRHGNLPKYFVKADHDVFINIPNLIAHLYSIKLCVKGKNSNCPESTSSTSVNYYIGGYLHEETPIITDLKSKFYVPSDLWFKKGETHYPNYLGGPCYILSGNLVESVYKSSFDIPLFPFEDIYITGLIAQGVLNLTFSPIRNMAFLAGEVTKLMEDKQQIQKAIAIHTMEPPEKVAWFYSKVIDRD